jgi:cytoskeleton protein RodZ
MSRKRSPKGVGAQLHAARERRGLSFRQVADSTKISVAALQALERNDISRLPGGVVIRGFVRAFATDVGLDPEATVAEFVRQFPMTSVTDGYPAEEAAAEDDGVHARPAEVRIRIHRRNLLTPLRCAAAGVLLAMIAAYAWAGRWVPLPPIRAGANVPLALAGLVGSAIGRDGGSEQAAGTAGLQTTAVQTPGERSAEPTARDRSAPPNAVGAPAKTDGLPSDGPSTPAAASSPAAQLAPDVSRLAEDSPTDPEGDRQAPGTVPDDEPLLAVLSVTRPSWLIATVDGRKTVNRLLLVGEQEALEAGRDLVLTVGDAGAIVMTLNGAAARSLGRPGEAVTARVNHANMRDYLRRDRGSASDTLHAR